MIPNYIYDVEQTTLFNNTTIKERLLNYRKLLYNNFIKDLKSFPIFKLRIINDYKLKVSEIDYQLTILNKKGDK